uniref:Rad50/SbcC-type AAA domain-containing protein n=1 Tax=Bosea sp. NBC_00436 TaxID=2969620 RepID=A0A9E8A469_9HYPH
MSASGPARFFLRRLAMTGPGKKLVTLTFGEHINVVWGASNSGKSYIVKALDFMSGAKTPLPPITEAQGYDKCWLELELPVTGTVTLERAMKGGDFGLHLGSVEPDSAGRPDRTLSWDHRSKGESISGFLLGELGLGAKEIARTLTGDKNAFTFRHYAAFVYTEETNMMGEWSPIRISDRSGETFDKNVLKFILTGVDDSAIVTTQNPDSQRTANSGKIEIIDEMLAAAQLEWERDYPGDPDLNDQSEKQAATIRDLQKMMSDRQSLLDDLRLDRRSKMESLRDAQELRTEISLSLQRFALLKSVYDSDLQRLASLEEGGAALLAGARRPCPLCGADPSHQLHAHGIDQVETTQRSVRAEMAKIASERADLAKATRSLEAEQEGLQKRAGRLSGEIDEIDRHLEEVKPLEVATRRTYEELDTARFVTRQGIALRQRIDELLRRKTQLAAFKPKSLPRGSVTSGIDGVTGHEFATVVQTLLHAWKFPGLPTVSFDDRTHDILIDGKSRRANGKGVRALMNAAFKIGVLLYCRGKELPHPGIVVLDSPLLSYRDPLTSRHGELDADEKEVKESGLKEHFYRFLVEKKDLAQFVIIENDTPPISLGEGSIVTSFTGSLGRGGRRGYY